MYAKNYDLNEGLHVVKDNEPDISEDARKDVEEAHAWCLLNMKARERTL